MPQFSPQFRIKILEYERFIHIMLYKYILFHPYNDFFRALVFNSNQLLITFHRFFIDIY